jgi:xylan 1,4-beta-xylosidase
MDEVMQRPYYVRNHNALTSGNYLSYPIEGSTNIYIEDEDGTPTYNFDIINQIYDSFVENNFIPIIEFGFMPFDLATYKTAPDKDYDLNG